MSDYSGPDEDAFEPSVLQSELRAAAWGARYGLTDGKIGQLVTYAELLAETNKVLNLTAITDEKGILEKHFLDSMRVLPLLDAEIRNQKGGKAVSVADVGTGAGFPGLVLKIMRPEIELHLIDSLAKRIHFLERVVSELGLQQVTCYHLRAEEAGRKPELRDSVDFVTARAVAELRVLSEYCLPLVKKGGLFAAMKGQAETETKAAADAIRKLGGTLEGVDQFTLEGTDLKRELIRIRKIAPTPPAYPRPAGKLQKKPL